MMSHPFRNLITLGLAVALLAGASVASAQSPADAKRTLKAWKAFYMEPGMIEVEVRYMRGTVLLTGYVPTEEDVKKAEGIANDLKGVKEVRNRIRVRDPEVAAGTLADLQAKLDKHVAGDEDLAKAKAKGKLDVVVADGGAVTVTGNLQDYTEAQQLINDIRRTPGVKSIDFKKLKY